MKCSDCGEVEAVGQWHDESGDTVDLCAVCGGFPHHEYTVKCPHCDLYILVN